MKYEFYHTLPIHGISIKEVASPKDYGQALQNSNRRRKGANK
jgi:hypothetical protein